MRPDAQQPHLAKPSIAAAVRAARVGMLAGLVVLQLGLATGCASFEAARLYRSGTRALDSGDSAGAVADLERAAQLVPQGSEIQNHLGLAYDAAGRPGAARAAYRRAVDLDCDNAAAQHNLEAAMARAAEVP